MTRQELLTRIRTHYLLGVYNYQKVSSQLKRYEGQGLSYSEINDILYYWYDVRKEDPKKSNGGIAIIDYILNDYRQWKEEQKKTEKMLKELEQSSSNIKYKEKEYIVNPSPIKKPLHLNFFKLE